MTLQAKQNSRNEEVRLGVSASDQSGFFFDDDRTARFYVATPRKVEWFATEGEATAWFDGIA